MTTMTPFTPWEFMRRLRRLVKTRPASDVVAFYDRYGPAVLPLLSERDRMTVGDVMHIADTVVELEAAASALPAGTTAGST